MRHRKSLSYLFRPIGRSTRARRGLPRTDCSPIFTRNVRPGIKVHSMSLTYRVSMDGLARFALPSRHGWVDPRAEFQHSYSLWRRYADEVTVQDRTERAFASKPVGVAFYGRGTLSVEKAGTYVLHMGFDDWLKLWINGTPVSETIRHDQGFAVTSASVSLRAGQNRIMIKLSNATNRAYRLWAFNMRVE